MIHRLTYTHATLASVALATVAGLCVSSAQAQEWGDLTGSFKLKGTAPAMAKIVPDKDVAVCGKEKLAVEKLAVGKDGGIANVAVYLLPAPGKKVAVHPDYEKAAKDKVHMDNKGCRFLPHMVAVRAGQALVLGNKDPVGHNMKAEFFNNTPFNDLIPASGKIEKTFAAGESAPVKVECSIHPWLNGWVVLREDPYIAITDENGQFTIKNLPVGEHTFIVWQENAGYVSDVSVGGKPTKWMRGRVKVTIKPGQNSLGNVEVTPKALKF
jgi:plastocyanin